MIIVRRVVGDSMLPGLAAGRLVFALRLVRPFGPRAGDVVIAAHDDREKIKRVQSVSDGKIFLLGDNPAASKDSRHFGWLPSDVVIARVIWPRVRQ